MNQAVMVERVVAEVMRQLMTNATPHQATANLSAPSETITRPLSLVMSDAVITGDLLENTANGERVVEILAKAIVTPSAKDWLRQHKVELRRIALSSKLPKKQLQQLAILDSDRIVAERVLEETQKAAFPYWKWERVTQPNDAARLAINTISNDISTGVVVLSDHPDEVACLANRSELVRAAAVFSISDVERVRTSLKCNVYVIDIGLKSTFELLKLLRSTTE